MTDVRKVYPRVPLEAESDLEPRRWWIQTPTRPGDLMGSFTDAEFAAAFVDAALVDDIISAARDVYDAYEGDDERTGTIDALIGALAAFDAAVQTETSNGFAIEDACDADD